jgi:capsular exopolysaccharide synthesis family protein
VEADSNTSARQTQLQSTLALYQNLYLNLLNSLETIRLARLQNTPNIVQIEPASIPTAPVRPRPLQNTGLAAAVGLMLAAGIVFLVEYLDDTLKTPEDVERILGLPVLGFVAQMHYKKRGKEDVFVIQQPRSPVAEAFRTLRTNLEFAAVEKPIRSLLVTSAGPSEGKTTVAANLAAVFSQAKKLDADMRRPGIHRMLGMANRSGLSNLFLGPDPAERIGRSRRDLPNLLVVTSGGLPPNPAELLASAKMDRILEEFHKHVDVVIIDTPPSLVSDAQILAGKVDAVVLVIQPGKTHAAMAKACLETLNRSGARIVGVVMNRIPRNRSYYYGGYQYYASRSENKGYYSRDKAERPVKEPAQRPAQKPVRAPAPMPAQEPVPSLLQKTLQTQTAAVPGGKPVQGPAQTFVQASARSTTEQRQPDTKPAAHGTSSQPEKHHPEESFLGVPSVHKLFENVDVAPHAAPLQAKPPDNSGSLFDWAFPPDNSRS